MRYSWFEGAIIHLDTESKTLILEEQRLVGSSYITVLDEGEPKQHFLGYDEKDEPMLIKALDGNQKVAVFVKDWHIVRVSFPNTLF